MIRVLHITLVLQAAGIESFIMNMYRHIDRSKVQFDFLVMRDEKEFYDEEIRSLGGKKYTIPENMGNTLVKVAKDSRQIEAFLRQHSYDVVHIHYTTPLRAPYVRAAKKAGAKVRIYHSHSAEVSGKSSLKRIIYQRMRHGLNRWTTDFFACSKAAADWMFTPETAARAKVIYNGIDIERFRFNARARQEVRDEYHLGDRFVVIHTGRFLDQKNHRFVVSLFAELKKDRPDAKLLLLGTGDLLGEIRTLTHSLGVENDVVFLGVRDDVERFLSAADCYVMPSLYEGLPVAAVEAQCAGLPCVLSENITREVALTDLVRFLSLDAPVTEWKKAVLEAARTERRDGSQAVADSGYSVAEVAAQLQNFYEDAAKR